MEETSKEFSQDFITTQQPSDQDPANKSAIFYEKFHELKHFLENASSQEFPHQFIPSTKQSNQLEFKVKDIQIRGNIRSNPLYLQSLFSQVYTVTTEQEVLSTSANLVEWMKQQKWCESASYVLETKDHKNILHVLVSEIRPRPGLDVNFMLSSWYDSTLSFGATIDNLLGHGERMEMKGRFSFFSKYIFLQSNWPIYSKKTVSTSFKQQVYDLIMDQHSGMSIKRLSQPIQMNSFLKGTTHNFDISPGDSPVVSFIASYSENNLYSEQFNYQNYKLERAIHFLQGLVHPGDPGFPDLYHLNSQLAPDSSQQIPPPNLKALEQARARLYPKKLFIQPFAGGLRSLINSSQQTLQDSLSNHSRKSLFNQPSPFVAPILTPKDKKNYSKRVKQLANSINPFVHAKSANLSLMWNSPSSLKCPMKFLNYNLKPFNISKPNIVSDDLSHFKGYYNSFTTDWYPIGPNISTNYDFSLSFTVRQLSNFHNSQSWPVYRDSMPSVISKISAGYNYCGVDDTQNPTIGSQLFVNFELAGILPGILKGDEKYSKFGVRAQTSIPLAEPWLSTIDQEYYESTNNPLWPKDAWVQKTPGNSAFAFTATTHFEAILPFPGYSTHLLDRIHGLGGSSSFLGGFSVNSLSPSSGMTVLGSDCVGGLSLQLSGPFKLSHSTGSWISKRFHSTPSWFQSLFNGYFTRPRDVDPKMKSTIDSWREQQQNSEFGSTWGSIYNAILRHSRWFVNVSAGNAIAWPQTVINKIGARQGSMQASKTPQTQREFEAALLTSDPINFYANGSNIFSRFGNISQAVEDASNISTQTQFADNPDLQFHIPSIPDLPPSRRFYFPQGSILNDVTNEFFAGIRSSASIGVSLNLPMFSGLAFRMAWNFPISTQSGDIFNRRSDGFSINISL